MKWRPFFFFFSNIFKNQQIYKSIAGYTTCIYIQYDQISVEYFWKQSSVLIVYVHRGYLNIGFIRKTLENIRKAGSPNFKIFSPIASSRLHSLHIDVCIILILYNFIINGKIIVILNYLLQHLDIAQCFISSH